MPLVLASHFLLPLSLTLFRSTHFISRSSPPALGFLIGSSEQYKQQQLAVSLSLLLMMEYNMAFLATTKTPSNDDVEHEFNHRST